MPLCTGLQEAARPDDFPDFNLSGTNGVDFVSGYRRL